jgi:Ca2+-binding RTX toxin-like protein
VTLQGYQDSVSFAGGNDTITGGAGSDTYDLTGGNASLVLNGYNDMVFLHSTNATVADAGQGAVISIAGGGTDIIQGAASDPSLVVDLTGGLGGFTSVSSVLASLTSDGNGGALLSFGASHGSLDFVGVAPSALHAANFQIG